MKNLLNFTYYPAIACLLFATHFLSHAQSLSDKHSDKHIWVDTADVVSLEQLQTNKATQTTTVILSVFNKTLTFELEENESLFSQNSQALQALKGHAIVYKGRIADKPGTWARFTSYQGQLSGAYFDGEALILVRPYAELEDDTGVGVMRGDMNKLTDQSALVAIDTANIRHNATCGLHDHAAVESFGYSDYIDDLKNISNFSASSVTRQININLFADTEFVASSGGDGTQATVEMIDSLNVADGIFSEQLAVNISLDTVEELIDNGDLSSSDPEALVFALRYSSLPNPGLRHLFTGKNLDGSTIGIAFVGSLCRASSAGVTQRFGVLTSLVMTHELGHNFGAPHDNQSTSSCAATPSGFVMNPNINGGGSEFSQCSISRIEPVLVQTESFANTCIIPVEQAVINIVSQANLAAQVGLAYAYDADNTLDIEGDGPFIYSLDIGPENMTISELGVIEWTPTSDQAGSNFVQISVQNNVTQASQSFEVNVTTDAINLFEQGITSYTGPNNQDKSGGATFNENPYRVELYGNSWKQVLGAYNIKFNTILEFEFSSDVEAEIQGIGFDNNESLSPSYLFAVHGTQNWGRQDFRYTDNGNAQMFSIPVGQFFTGTFDRLLLVNDNDNTVAGANGIFSNIRIYEEEVAPQPPTTINFNEQTILPFLPGGQDGNGTALVVEDGDGFELTGNKWQRLVVEGVSINSNTVLEFEFKSTSIGEIHGIAFSPSNKLNESRTFNIYGTQDWGNQDFAYTDIGEFQRIIIPIGQYFTQSEAGLVFIMDQDYGNLTPNSTFRNVKIYTED